MNIQKILTDHKKWLNNEEDGKRANLRQADLRSADLRRANLQSADLQSANLEFADLERANLRSADLERADLRGANLERADLQSADLRGANLERANLDFSCWPLWCGSLDVKVDRKIMAQLAYHFCRVECDDEETKRYQDSLKELANEFHRIETEECDAVE